MPIRPENRARYPKDWPAISAAIRARANHRCEDCGVPNGELGGRSPSGKWHKAKAKGEKLLRIEWPQPGEEWWCEGYDTQLRIVRIVLTVAHLDHTPENCSPENLKAWCQRCHNAYDAPMRAAGIKSRRRALKAAADLFHADGRE
jgi:5-methylcytosine-specific restriction endonuclease McrA